MRAESPYIAGVSLRSRRLRTLGLGLAIVVIDMAVYGYEVVMPGISRAIVAIRTRSGAPAHSHSAIVSAPTPPQPATDRVTRQIARRLLVVYLYWTVCGLFLLATVVVAWLDVREVSRWFAEKRRDLWVASAAEMNSASNGDGRERHK